MYKNGCLRVPLALRLQIAPNFPVHSLSNSYLPQTALQTDLGEASEGGPGAPPQFIKPEHLSSVIASSHADYLVVIGDRNMKNDTVQARRAGKLVEQPYVARINSLLESWGAAMGLRGGSGGGGGSVVGAGVGAGASAAANADGPLSDKAVAALTEDALWERLKRLSIVNMATAQERIQRIVATAAEVADMRRARRGAGTGGGPLLLAGDRLTDGDHAFVRPKIC